MPKDIRHLAKNFKEETIALSANHSKKFEVLLHSKIQHQKKKKRNFKLLSIAVSVVLLLAVAINFYPGENALNKSVKEIRLGSISPELQTIEAYYENSIHLFISNLSVTIDNEEVLESYLLKIKELTLEYKSLTKELNTQGINDDTIAALIRNLQLRLELLQRLKKQLKQLKNLKTKQDETQII